MSHLHGPDCRHHRVPTWVPAVIVGALAGLTAAGVAGSGGRTSPCWSCEDTHGSPMTACADEVDVVKDGAVWVFPTGESGFDCEVQK